MKQHILQGLLHKHLVELLVLVDQLVDLDMPVL